MLGDHERVLCLLCLAQSFSLDDLKKFGFNLTRGSYDYASKNQELCDNLLNQQWPSNGGRPPLSQDVANHLNDFLLSKSSPHQDKTKKSMQCFLHFFKTV
jgi:hypothetical protein